MKAGMGQKNHSAAGPKRRTRALPKMAREERWKTRVARATMTTRPTMLVAMEERTSPPRYSETERGDAKRLRKLRDQTSSRKAVVMPCMTRDMKSQRRTAPSMAGTKSKRAPETELRYRVMNPQRMMSMATQEKS